MKFGLFLIESPHRAHVGPSGRRADPGQGAALTSPEYLGGLARFAEEVGFDFVSFPEHVVLPVDYESRYPYQQYEGGDFKRYPYDETAFPEPITALTFVAAVTERLELGTSVLILPQRNPVILAKQLATLDALSRGRVSLTAGIGWFREEFEAIGVHLGAPRTPRGRVHPGAAHALARRDLDLPRRDRLLRADPLPAEAHAAGGPGRSTSAGTASPRRAARDGSATASCRSASAASTARTWRRCSLRGGRRQPPPAATPPRWSCGWARRPTSRRSSASPSAARAASTSPSPAPDLDQAKRELEQIANEVIERF